MSYRSLAAAESLLLIILDDLRRANFRFVRVKPDVAKGTSLAQEVPALIQFDLDLYKPLTISFGVRPLLVQSVFLCDKALNMIEDRLIFDLIFHESLLPHGYDRNGQSLMLRPPETAVNRCSGQHDDPGVGCQKKENVPRIISRRLAVRRLPHRTAPPSPPPLICSIPSLFIKPHPPHYMSPPAPS